MCATEGGIYFAAFAHILLYLLNALGCLTMTLIVSTCFIQTRQDKPNKFKIFKIIETLTVLFLNKRSDLV